jgi:hypothetical protein
VKVRILQRVVVWPLGGHPVILQSFVVCSELEVFLNAKPFILLFMFNVGSS